MLFRRTVDGGKELVQQRAIAGRRAAQEERRMRESKRENSDIKLCERSMRSARGVLARAALPCSLSLYVLVPI